jgi:hypothetical protein
MAQDLHCGDLFWFRGDQYLCVNCFTDLRTTQSIVVTHPYGPRGEVVWRSVTVLRLFRTFRVDVYGHAETPLTVFDNTAEEVTPLYELELAALRRRHEVGQVLEKMTPDERKEVFRGLGGYCPHCGRDQLPCHCENNE